MSLPELEVKAVHVDGHRINVRTTGAGPMVLLCHGFPESWYSWRHQIAPLAEAGYQVVVMDMRGYGRSSKPTDYASYRITELVRDCVGVVQGLGASEAVIIGHDWGAPVAWTAAWTRPDVFRAVVGMSVPFGGRGLHALPGDPFGETRPTVAHRELGGEDLLFYQEHHCLPAGVGERDAERDLNDWLSGLVHSVSAEAPLPPEYADSDLTRLPKEQIQDYVRATMCLPRGVGFFDLLPRPERLPEWLPQEDFDHWVAELEHGGMTGPLNYYRAQDLNWELLGAQQGKPLTVPALFIGGDKDVATVWGQEAIERAGEVLTDLRGSVIVPDCGHWIQQEKPEVVNDELIKFLKSL